MQSPGHKPSTSEIAFCPECNSARLEPGPCAVCAGRRYGADETHERLALFTPAPAQIPGQLEL